MSQEPPADELYYVYSLNGSTGAYLDEPLTPQEIGDAALEHVARQSGVERRILNESGELSKPGIAPTSIE
jgi:hypothetical protein